MPGFISDHRKLLAITLLLSIALGVMVYLFFDGQLGFMDIDIGVGVILALLCGFGIGVFKTLHALKTWKPPAPPEHHTTIHHSIKHKVPEPPKAKDDDLTDVLVHHTK